MIDRSTFFQVPWVGIEPTLPKEPDFESKGASFVMDSIMKNFYNTSGIIMVLRFNPGGTDRVVLDILSYFTDRKTKIFTKKIKTGVQKEFECEVIC